LTITLFSTILSIIGLFGMNHTVTWLLVRGNKNRLTKCFIVTHVSVMFWLISQLLIVFSVNRQQFWISYVIGNIGISMLAPSWMMFAAEYSDFRKKLRRVCDMLPVLSVFFFASVITNPMHHWYYAVFEYRNVVYGPIYYLSQITYYLLLLAGMVLMFIKRPKSGRNMKKQLVFLSIAVAVPMCINTLTVIKVIHTKIMLTPMFFAFSAAMILIAIGRYGLLDVNRIAINDTIDGVDSAVLVFDADEVMTYKNRSAKKMISVGTGASLDDMIEAVKAKTGIELDKDSASAELSIDGVYYNIRQNFCTNRKGKRIARIVIVSDVSEYYELLAAEKKLSLEQERNRIAQEMHDSAGHTFTLISSLSRILDADLKNTGAPENILSCVREIDGLSRSGVTQLRCSINDLRSDEFMTSVTRAISTIASSVRGVGIEVCTQGEEDEGFAFCVKEVYDNVRETITNSMRYSGADRIDIIVKFREKLLEIYIYDNGCGCSEITENNGLYGIRKRTEALGGTVKFSSIEGEGFNTIIRIPKGNGDNNDKCTAG